jgi:cytochrome c oxidase assembly protein subunit 11
MTDFADLSARIPHTRQAQIRRNLAVALVLVAVVAAMGALAYYSVPLYRLFCQVTGFGGTTQTAVDAPGPVALPPVSVRFDANVAANLLWRFTPPEPVEVRLGEEHVVAFSVTNLDASPAVGSATFNVTPMVAGKYFSKIQCFCFTEQLLMPGEAKELPVSFFVDPAIADNPDTRNVDTITLSYTFFNKGPAALERVLQQQPSAGSRSAQP